MRLVFAGTPEFARAALERLHRAGHDIALVLTRPDRPAGRGMRLQPIAVKAYALDAGLHVEQPRSLRDPEALQRLAAVGHEAMVVAAYGLILPAPVLQMPRHGCINIHASLLPRWRGAAPIVRAIEAGDRETGITIMQMDEGLDTGPMLLSAAEPIHADDTAASLHDRLARLGARLVESALAELEAGRLVPVPQPEAGACYANKVSREEAHIDWSAAAESIERRIRAFDPFPGAVTELGGHALKVWRASVLARAPDRAEPGTLLEVGAQRLVVACGSGALSLQVVQRAGGRRMPIGEFLRGQRPECGERLG
ncbi:MAG: methionyl-tRNA formyltransferase [Burkholderiales bacterium]|nr:MAG: methionyl-tRNA formyltransferase [Burkholderiales bacterium]